MARRRGKVDAAERLKLAETLLETDDLATCARCALDWLGRSAGVARGLCLVGSQESPSVLQPVATLAVRRDRKSTRLNSSHITISYAVFCLKKKNTKHTIHDDTPRVACT